MEHIELQHMKYARRILWRRAFLALLLTVLLGFPSKHAYCMMQRLENSELVARSNLVIYGMVKEICTKGENREAIVLVECVLKGKLPAKGEVRVIFLPGMEDSPLFEKNERVLLFLGETTSELFQTVGGFQGKFSFGTSTN